MHTVESINDPGLTETSFIIQAQGNNANNLWKKLVILIIDHENTFAK